MPLDVPRRELRRLFQKHGPDLLKDPKRCEVLLLRACPGYTPHVKLLLAALEENIPADLGSMAGRVALDKLLTVFARQLEERSYAPLHARWAVEAWTFALGLMGEEGLTPAPWLGKSKDEMWATHFWARCLAVAFVLIALPLTWMLNGVYGWALGSVAGWWAAGESGLRPGGVVGLTVLTVLFALACHLDPKTRHTFIRGFFVLAPAGALLVAALVDAAALPDPLLATLAVFVGCPAVAISALIRLLLPSSRGAVMSTCLAAVAAAAIGVVGVLTDSFWGWAVGAAAVIAFYDGVHGYLEARGSRAERPAFWVVRQTLQAAALGVVLGAVEGGLGYALVTGFVNHFQSSPYGFAAVMVFVEVVVFVELTAWVLLAWAVVAGYAKLPKPKPRAQGGDLFDKHIGPVRAVAFSADGGRILSGSDDGCVRLWDVETRRTWRRFLRFGRAGACPVVLFLPREGQIITAAGPTLRRWDAESGDELNRLRFGRGWHARLALSIARYPQHLLVGRFVPGRDRWLLYRLGLNEGALPQAAPSPEKSFRHDGITDVCFSPDGRLAVSAGEDSRLRLWDLEAGAEVSLLSGHREAVNAVAFSHDGNLLASADDDGRLGLWDARDGKLLDMLPGHVAEALCVCFSPAGDRLLSGGADETVRLWDVVGRRELQRFEGEEGRRLGAIHYVAFALDGRSFVSGGADHCVRVWLVAE